MDDKQINLTSIPILKASDLVGLGLGQAARLAETNSAAIKILASHIKVLLEQLKISQQELNDAMNKTNQQDEIISGSAHVAISLVAKRTKEILNEAEQYKAHIISLQRENEDLKNQNRALKHGKPDA